MATLQNKATINYDLLGVPVTIDSNTIDFEKVENVVTLTKAVAPTAGKSGDTVTFTITALATSAITNTIVTDILTGFTFVAGSVTVGGVSQPTADPTTGINLGNIALGILTTITFQCTVD